MDAVFVGSIYCNAELWIWSKLGTKYFWDILISYCSWYCCYSSMQWRHQHQTLVRIAQLRQNIEKCVTISYLISLLRMLPMIIYGGYYWLRKRWVAVYHAYSLSCSAVAQLLSGTCTRDLPVAEIRRMQISMRYYGPVDPVAFSGMGSMQHVWGIFASIQWFLIARWNALLPFGGVGIVHWDCV